MSDNKQHGVDYELLQQSLASANASLEAAEVHGVVCGVITTGRELPQEWFTELFDQAEAGDLLAEEGKQLVNQLYDQTNEEIEGAGVGMRLLLPEDSASLPIRAQAVTEWCQGFLYGLGLSGQEAHKKLSAEAQEAIEDIGQFTRMDVAALSAEEAAEDEEDALMEITEFLWVAAMLIRESFLDQSLPDGARREYH